MTPHRDPGPAARIVAPGLWLLPCGRVDVVRVLVNATPLDADPVIVVDADGDCFLTTRQRVVALV